MLELEAIQREFGVRRASARSRPSSSTCSTAQGYFVNEYGINNVLLHVAIAVDRVTTALVPTPSADVAADARLGDRRRPRRASSRGHFDVALGGARPRLPRAICSRRASSRPAHDGRPRPLVETTSSRGRSRRVRRIVEQAGEEYLVDLDDEDFIVRLALHVRQPRRARPRQRRTRATR